MKGKIKGCYNPSVSCCSNVDFFHFTIDDINRRRATCWPFLRLFHVVRLHQDILFSKACLQHSQTVTQPCMWLMEELSQFSIGQTAQSLTCSIMEKPHRGLDDWMRVLQACFQEMMSDSTTTQGKSPQLAPDIAPSGCQKSDSPRAKILDSTIN